MPRKRLMKIVAALSLGLWGVTLLSGLGWLWAYDAAPGAQGPAPRHWPAEAKIAFAGSEYNLLVFLHPHCPCSKATLGELARIMAHSRDRIHARVLVTHLADFPEGALREGLFETAAAIPGVTVEIDHGGIEARRFAAASSGQTLLYDPQGQLIFSGGITASRGHWGDNDGEDAILALVAKERTDVCQSPVYGCELFKQSVAESIERRQPCPK